MWLHWFDIISLSIMTGSRYINTMNCFAICMQGLSRFGYKLCNRSLGVHEPKLTPHVKCPHDVSQSYTSSDSIV